MKEIAGGAASTAAQIKQITPRQPRALVGVGRDPRPSSSDIRRITERNAAGVKETRGNTRG